MQYASKASPRLCACMNNVDNISLQRLLISDKVWNTGLPWGIICKSFGNSLKNFFEEQTVNCLSSIDERPHASRLDGSSSYNNDEALTECLSVINLKLYSVSMNKLIKQRSWKKFEWFCNMLRSVSRTATSLWVDSNDVAFLTRFGRIIAIRSRARSRLFVSSSSSSSRRINAVLLLLGETDLRRMMISNDWIDSKSRQFE